MRFGVRPRRDRTSSGTAPARAGRWSTGSRKHGRPPREASVRGSSLPRLLGSCHARASTTLVAVGSSVTTPIDAPAGRHRERRQRRGEQLRTRTRGPLLRLCRERVEEPQRLVARPHLQHGLGPAARRGAHARRQPAGAPAWSHRRASAARSSATRWSASDLFDVVERGRGRGAHVVVDVAAAAVAARPARSSGRMSVSLGRRVERGGQGHRRGDEHLVALVRRRRPWRRPPRPRRAL